MLKYFTQNALLLFAISILLVSCKTAKKPIKNLAYQYQKNSRKAKIEYLVHHQNADTSTIYLKMPAQNLTFDEKKATQLQTQIKLYEQIKEGGLLDTFFRNITVKQNLNDKDVALWKYNLPIKSEKNYLLSISMIEKNTGKQFSKSFRIWKKAELADENEQNFLCINTTNRQFLFENYATVSSDIMLRYRDENSPILEVSYFKMPQQLALPPFVTDRKMVLPSKADSSFQIQGLSLIHI